MNSIFEQFPEWESIIGIESHAQLLTKSKLFSNAPVNLSTKPNTQISEFDLALPGTLPMAPNYTAIKHVINIGLALGAKISLSSKFSRKSYFYPDLPKGYQISQNKIPIIVGGKLNIQINSNNYTYNKIIYLSHAHLEEDAGKLLHKDIIDNNTTKVDLNRAGVPLIEIVTKPNICTAAEAVAYVTTLHNLLVWLDACDGNMQDGSFRFDVNISVRRKGVKTLNTRTEIKNLNSFRFLNEAICFETKRQIQLIKSGNEVIQETRLYDSNLGKTFTMRSKEHAYDYRYFPDPDLLQINISQKWINQLLINQPELPQCLKKRFAKEFTQLTISDINNLVQSRYYAIYFEDLVNLLGKFHYKIAANWMTGEFLAHLNYYKISIKNAPVMPIQLSKLLQLIINRKISYKLAKEVFHIMWNQPSSEIDYANKIIKANNFEQILDIDSINTIVDCALLKYSNLVEKYKAGEKKTINLIIGKILKITNKKVDPVKISEILKQKLNK